MATKAMPGKQQIVLCVDDDAAVLAVTSMALEMDGCTVLTATSGPAALDVFCSQPVDAVVLDFDMPGMNGGEVAAAMQQLKPQVPRLLFTGRADLPAEALAAVDDICAKPGGVAILRSQLRALLLRQHRSQYLAG
jgi:CheY-like chemotaxis protein